MNKQSCCISAIEYANSLTYGVWDGTVCMINNGEKSKIVLSSPATAIHSIADAIYIGTTCGDVWEIKNRKATQVLKTKESLKHTDILLESVIGIHALSPSKLVVVYIFGEIVIYSIESCCKMKTVKTDGKITNSYLEEGKLLYIVDSKMIEIYDIALDKTVRIKALLSNTTLEHAIFMQDTNQNTIVYCTPFGKVCVDYVNRLGTGFVFKAHRKAVENKEMYYPVTLMKAFSSTRILTGGGDGDLHLWNVKEKTKVQTIVSTGKCIVTGDIKKNPSGQPSLLILALSNGMDGLCEIDGIHEIIEVPLDKYL